MKGLENYRPNIIIDKNYPQYYLEQLVNELKSGFATSQHNKNNKGIIHIRPMNINVKGELTLENSKFINIDNKTEYLLKKNDILFNNTNSKELVGKTCFIKEDLHALYSNHMTRIRINPKKIIPQYLALYLHNLWYTGYFMEQSHKWIGQAGISIEELKQTPIYLPPLDEQKEIVRIIGAEQNLIYPAYQLIEVFTKKIQDTIENLFKE